MIAARQSGFTLIELMTVLVVVALLLAIAVPSYNEQMRKVRRTEAMQGLTRIAQAQERFMFTYGRYSSSIGGVVGPDPATSGLGLPVSTKESDTDDAYYDFTLALGETAGGEPDPLSYVVFAHPQGAAQQSDECGTLQLASTGARVAAKPPCW